MTAPSYDYCLIPLTQGQSTKVSPHRYAYLSQWKWFAWWCESKQGFYARRNSRVSEGTPRHGILMHRVILGLPYGNPLEGDHVNRDSLDNTDDNLRIVDDTGQARNHGQRSDNLSGFRGVYFYSHINKWAAQIRVNKRPFYLGVFLTKEAAAHAYDVAALKHFGESAHLNLPMFRPVREEFR